MKLLLLIGICSCLSGCALTLEMMAISGISYLATGKSLSDNAFSLVTNRDCALHRIIINEVICVKNEHSPNNTNSELMLADATSTIEDQVSSAQTLMISAEDVSSDALTSIRTANTRDFPVAIQETKTPATVYSSTETFAVVGSFNNYQYAQRRIEKYVNFNPQIIKNQAHSATRYRVVVGPIKRHDVTLTLPIMVGAETQLPWEIDLCVNDMSPPPCNTTLAMVPNKQ